jgi:thioredoxin 1
MGKIINVKGVEEFQNTLESSSDVVLVDFWAQWCGPCRMLSPTLDSIADENENVTIIKVNVDENADLSSQYGIRNIPTVLIFNNKVVSEKFVGPKKKEDILALIDSVSTETEAEIEAGEVKSETDESEN